MRPGTLAILGVAAYSTFLVLGMPARWVAERVLPPGPRSIALQEIDGTIWKGSARASFGSHAGIFTLDRVEWSFRPAALLQGRAAYRVSARGAGVEAEGEVGRSFGGWSMRGLSARADASAATAFAPLMRTWRPEGKVTLASRSLQAEGGGRWRGDMRVEWEGAAIALSEVKPLGSYRAEANAEGAAARLAVTTLSGPLRVTGQGSFTFPAQLAFTGEARAEGPNAQALAPVLDLLGPRKPDGSHAIEWRTR